MLLASVPQLHTKWNGDGSRERYTGVDDEPGVDGASPALVEVEPGHFAAVETS